MAAAASGGTVVGYTVAHRYNVIKILGAGSFGKVYLVHDTKAKEESNKCKALKVVCLSSMTLTSASMSGTLNEAKLQRDLNHPNIVQFYDSFFDSDSFYICTEYCEGGDLDIVIKAAKDASKALPEDQVWLWIIQVILGVKHIHQNGILHRDIKTRNIFLRNNIIKIGDFGISKALENGNNAYTCIGTPFYMSPEAVSYSGYNDKSDIWAIGCVLYELVAQKPAYEGRSMFELVVKIKHAELPRWPRGYSRDLQTLFAGTMEKDPNMRPSALQLQKMPCVEKHLKSVEEELTTWLQKSKSQSVAGGAPKIDNKNTHRSDQRVKIDNDIDKFWDTHDTGKDKGTKTSSKSTKQSTAKSEAVVQKPNNRVKIRVTVFEAVVDNATKGDVEKIIRQISQVEVEDYPTLTENSMEGAYTQTSKMTVINFLKGEMETTLGKMTYHKAYLFLKSARSQGSSGYRSESDIDLELSKLVPDQELRQKLDKILFWEMDDGS